MGGDDGQGGVFSIDTKGGIDLVAINTRVGADGFTGGFMRRTHTGNIELAAGQTLRSGSVNLTADGGFVIVVAPSTHPVSTVATSSFTARTA